MKKKAKEIKKGDKIQIAGKVFSVEDVELSDIGKQGARKCRLILTSDSGEKIVIIRPEDYSIDLA